MEYGVLSVRVAERVCAATLPAAEEVHHSHLQNACSAAANAYSDGMGEDEWLDAAFRRLVGMH